MKDFIISEVQIIPIKPHNGLVAFASCVYNDQLYLGNIAIYTRLSGDGYRLVFPARTLPNGLQVNSVHPINRSAGEMIENAILGKFNEFTKRRCNDESKICRRS